MQSLSRGGAAGAFVLPDAAAAAAAAACAGVNSLTACLAHFVAAEHLRVRADNGYACEVCRTRKHGAAPAPAPAPSAPAAAADGGEEEGSASGPGSSPVSSVAGSAGSAAGSSEAPDRRPIVLVDAVKRLLLLAPPPPVLVVHLKRFCGSARTHKVGGHIAFPEVLDLALFTAEDAAAAGSAGADADADADAPPPPPPPLFRLAAAVVHAGTMAGGHYVAYVRHGAPAPFRFGGAGGELRPPCGGLWSLASDKSVAPTTLADVLAAEAYLLFYERCERAGWAAA